jgi:hypothetical protein
MGKRLLYLSLVFLSGLLFNLRSCCGLARRAFAPVRHVRFIDNEAIVAGGFKAGSRTNCAIHVGYQSARSAHEVVMIVANSIFK